MKNKILFASFLAFSFLFNRTIAQGPWENNLMLATSIDGISFTNTQVFQDSSGVPSVIRLNTGVLIAAFQWFPYPVGGDNWDSIAVKFSTNEGLNWTDPVSANFTGIPANFQRPFDPTLVETATGDIRMYFSDGLAFMPDTSINCYSAISTDGINYTFEGSYRFNSDTTKVIDPACTIFDGTYHYTAPKGAAQDGVYHATSVDGLTFVQQADITSDAAHNWTGNLLVDSNEMVFYGCGSNVWLNTTTDGITWDGYVNTNVFGGDPAVVQLTDGTYLMIYVGFANPSALEEASFTNISIYPNPVTNQLFIKGIEEGNNTINIFNIQGEAILTNRNMQSNSMDVSTLVKGIYFLEITNDNNVKTFRSKIVKN